jgi:hypothetical protein
LALRATAINCPRAIAFAFVTAAAGRLQAARLCSSLLNTGLGFVPDVSVSVWYEPTNPCGPVLIEPSGEYSNSTLAEPAGGSYSSVPGVTQCAAALATTGAAAGVPVLA